MGFDWLGFSHIQLTRDIVEFCDTLQTWLQRLRFSIYVKNRSHVVIIIIKLCKVELSAISSEFDPTFQLF